jgi:hypothetical protein
MSKRFFCSLASVSLIFALCLDAHAQDRKRRRAPPSPGSPQPGRDTADTAKRRKPREAPKDPNQGWKVRKRPEITSFAPAQGAPGSVVTIFGRYFGRTTVVRFNGRTLPILRRARGQMAVRIPRKAASDHFVLAKPGFRDVSSAKTFFVTRRPQIRKVRPLRGTPGVIVRVRGQHFLPTDTLLINNLPLHVLKIRPRGIKARLPKGAVSGRLSIRRGNRIVASSKFVFQVALPPPLVTGISPLSGSPGTVVRLTGRNFDTKDIVRLAGRKVPIRSRSNTMFEVVIGRHNTGRFAITGPGGRLAHPKPVFTIIRPARLKSFSPKFGPPGTRIRIFGNHFLPSDRPYLNNRALTVRTTSATQIVAEIPAGVASGFITLRRGTRIFRLRRRRGLFRVQLAPALVAVRPAAAPPGALIEIQANNLDKSVSVLLSGQRLRIVKRNLRANTIWVKLPGRARTGRLVVVTSAGSSSWRRNFVITQYASLRAFFPLAGVTGTTIRVKGANFHKGVRVYLGKYELQVTRILPTQLWARIPATVPPTSGRIIVQSYGRKVASPLKFRLTAAPPEVAFRVAPLRVYRGGEVTLFLTPPRRYVSVYYNGRLLPKRVLRNGAQLVVTIPADAKSGYFEIEYRGRRYRAKSRVRVR